MLHLEHPTSLGISMPLSTRVMLPVVSALEQISLSKNYSNPNSPSQSEDMVTDKDQSTQVSSWYNSANQSLTTKSALFILGLILVAPLEDLVIMGYTSMYPWLYKLLQIELRSPPFPLKESNTWMIWLI